MRRPKAGWAMRRASAAREKLPLSASATKSSEPPQLALCRPGSAPDAHRDSRAGAQGPRGAAGACSRYQEPGRWGRMPGGMINRRRDMFGPRGLDPSGGPAQAGAVAGGRHRAQEVPGAGRGSQLAGGYEALRDARSRPVHVTTPLEQIQGARLADRIGWSRSCGAAWAWSMRCSS